MAMISPQESRDLLTFIASKLELPKNIKNIELSIGTDCPTEITVTYFPESLNNDLSKRTTRAS